MILYIAKHSHVRDLGMTKLYKLIYFADATSLREYGHTISGSEYIKYEHGPVPSRGEKALKLLNRSNLISIKQRQHYKLSLNEVLAHAQPDLKILSPEDQIILSTICKTKGQATAAELSDESHREPAWLYAKLLDKLSPSLMYYGTSEDPNGL